MNWKIAKLTNFKVELNSLSLICFECELKSQTSGISFCVKLFQNLFTINCILQGGYIYNELLAVMLYYFVDRHAEKSQHNIFSSSHMGFLIFSSENS